MMFLARFLGWALLLGLPGWAFGDAYRLLLARALETVLALFGQSVTLERVDAIAPMDLVLFAALTLPSDVWPWRRRLLALLAGSAALIAAQIVIGTMALAGVMAAAAGARGSEAWERLVQGALGAAGWLAAITAWTLGPGAAMLDRVTARGKRRAGVRGR